MCNGAKITTTTAGHDLIEIKPRGRVFGGHFHIDTSGSGTNAVILFDGSTDVFDRTALVGGIHGAHLEGNGFGEGYGIKCYSDGDPGGPRYVTAIDCSDISMVYLNTMIRLECNEDSGDSNSFVNGNLFRGIRGDFFEFGVDIVTSGTAAPAANANVFSNFILQCRSNMTAAARVVRTGSIAQRNSFTNFSVFDFSTATSTTALEFQSTAVAPTEPNYFQGTGVEYDEISWGNSSKMDIVNIPGVPRNHIRNFAPVSLTVNSTLRKNQGLKGQHIDNTGASAGLNFTLDSQCATQGCEWIISRVASFNVDIENPNAETIYDPISDTTTTADLRILTDGVTVHLKCYQDNELTIVGRTGTFGAASGGFDIEYGAF